MKYLTVIWAILILALACYPCMDSGEAFAKTVQGNYLYEDNAHNEAHNEDLCSPLCDCSCCGGFKVALHVPQLSEQKHPLQGVYLSTYVEHGAAHPSFSFWHPPRV